MKENGYSIVHSHMNTLAVFSLFAAWLGGAKRRIVHNHTVADRRDILRSVLKYSLRPFSKIFANQYIACSKHCGEWMFGRQFYLNRVRILNNAIDIEKFLYDKEKRTRLRKNIGIKENTFVMGHVGRFVPVKNHDFLFDILKELVKIKEDSCLILVGDGPLMTQMVSEARRRNLEEHISFLGLCDNVSDIYSVMDAFVLPSWYEGLPVVALEAQANGLPCFISDCVTDECKLTSTLSFLSLKDSAAMWADKIAGASRERNHFAREELTVAGFDIVREAGKLQKIYESLS